MVVRQWTRKDCGPGRKVVFLTKATVDRPAQSFDDYGDRNLPENCRLKIRKQQWDLGHPPQKTDRAVRVPVTFTLRMVASTNAFRWQCEW